MSGPKQDAAGPAPLMQLATGYWSSQAFLTANRIGLFTLLGEDGHSLEGVAGALRIRPRPARLLLNACVALGLVEETAGVFRNSPLSRAYLLPGGAGYMGNAVRYSDDMYSAWGQLEQALREDAPARKPDSYLGGDPEQTRHFVYGMHDRALGIANALAAMVDLSGCRRLLDVGGGPGTYAGLLSRRFPQLRAQVLDLAPVVALAGEILAAMGVADRVTTVPGDYHRTPFPAGMDAVLISGVFHREGESACRKLIGRAVDSLTAGGQLLVSDVFTDAGGTGPAFATLFGLNMLLSAPDGGVHADADVASWMEAAGLERVTVRPFPPPMPHRLVTGRKPS